MPEEAVKQQETGCIRCLFLAGLKKSVLAMKSESFALLAGAIDSITDFVAFLAVQVGILLSTRATKTFRLGLYKLENFLSIAIALFIFLSQLVGKV